MSVDALLYHKTKYKLTFGIDYAKVHLKALLQPVMCRDTCWRGGVLIN